MKHDLVKLPDTDSPAPMPAARNRAADIVIRTSSFLRHYSFRHSSLRSRAYYDFAGLKVATSPTGNQFLWNGKRLDPQLGWYVYHYRHYSPELGRWPSRDPIEEDGGVNLYGFVGNGPLSGWDALGRIPAERLNEIVEVGGSQGHAAAGYESVRVSSPVDRGIYSNADPLTYQGASFSAAQLAALLDQAIFSADSEKIEIIDSHYRDALDRIRDARDRENYAPNSPFLSPFAVCSLHKCRATCLSCCAAVLAGALEHRRRGLRSGARACSTMVVPKAALVCFVRMTAIHIAAGVLLANGSDRCIQTCETKP